MIKLAIIDNAIDTRIYNPIRHWKKFIPVGFEVFNATENELPGLDLGFTHLIVTGSEATILDRDPWVEKEIDFIREAAERGLSILGSCYGHQLLAVALAGPDSVRRTPFPEGGWISVEITETNSLLGEMGTAETFTLHFDEVVDLGKDFNVILSTDKCPIQGFQYKDKAVWGLQIHPEIDGEEGRILLENLIALSTPATPFYSKSLAKPVRDSGHIRPIVENFLKNHS